MQKTELNIVKEVFVTSLKQHIKSPDFAPEKGLVKELYPALSKARGLGYSFFQIAKHLESYGITVKQDHLKSFYQECAGEHIVQINEACIKRLEEEAALLEAINAANQASIPTRNSQELASAKTVPDANSDEEFNPLALVMGSLQAPPRPEGKAQLRCKQLKPGIKQLEKKSSVPAWVYEEGILEHPAIPGLHLNREERLYGTFLEIVDTASGESRFEELKEKALRVLWRKKGTQVQGSTDGDFNTLNVDIFAPEHR